MYCHCALPSGRTTLSLCARAQPCSKEQHTGSRSAAEAASPEQYGAGQLKSNSLDKRALRTGPSVPFCLAKLLAVIEGAAGARQTTLNHPKARASTATLGCSMLNTSCWDYTMPGHAGHQRKRALRVPDIETEALGHKDFETRMDPGQCGVRRRKDPCHRELVHRGNP